MAKENSEQGSFAPQQCNVIGNCVDWWLLSLLQHQQRCNALRSQPAAATAPARAPFRVLAQKKVIKRQQVR